MARGNPSSGLRKMEDNPKVAEAFETWWRQGATASQKNAKLVAEACGFIPRLFWLWYTRYGWKEKAAARRREQAYDIAKSKDQDLIKERERILGLVRAGFAVVSENVTAILNEYKAKKEGKDGKIEPGMTPAQMPKALQQLIVAYQLLTGQPTKIEGNEVWSMWKRVAEEVEYGSVPDKDVDETSKLIGDGFKVLTMKGEDDDWQDK